MNGYSGARPGAGHNTNHPNMDDEFALCWNNFQVSFAVLRSERVSERASLCGAQILPSFCLHLLVADNAN